MREAKYSRAGTVDRGLRGIGPLLSCPSMPVSSCGICTGGAMKTAVTEQLGIDFPILAFSHCRDVVAEVSKAGGFGVLGAITFTPEEPNLSFSGSRSRSATSRMASTSCFPRKRARSQAAPRASRTSCRRLRSISCYIFSPTTASKRRAKSFGAAPVSPAREAFSVEALGLAPRGGASPSYQADRQRSRITDGRDDPSRER